MTIFNSIDEFKPKSNTVLTIGTFDGVHIGHSKIINRLNEVASTKRLESTVLTFFPHPRMVLQKESNIKLIHTIEERKTILQKCGIKNLIVHPFSKDFSRLSAVEFVRDVLVNKLNIAHIIIGYDHRFGRNRTANIEDLKEFGELYNFTVEEISAQDINDVSVSSTKIRNALSMGNITIANSYLGKCFEINGTVKKGKSIGRTINYPTANIHITDTYKLIPKNGVYVAKATIKGTSYFGMMNIGYNPTVNSEDHSIEIHLFNFNQDIYNEKIKVELLNYVREEQKFDSLDSLKHQLALDKAYALNYINDYD